MGMRAEGRTAEHHVHVVIVKVRRTPCEGTVEEKEAQVRAAPTHVFVC